MKFSIEKDQILEALQKVQSIVGQRTTLPNATQCDARRVEGQSTLKIVEPFMDQLDGLTEAVGRSAGPKPSDHFCRHRQLFDVKPCHLRLCTAAQPAR